MRTGWSLALALLIAGVMRPALSQTSSSGTSWSGQAQCQITLQTNGYTHQETQTWTITAGAPTAQGAMQVYPGTWSTSGNGGLQKPQGVYTLAAQWNTKAPEISAPIAVFVRASDQRLIIKSWHAQLHAPAATQLVRQMSATGAAPTQSSLAYDAYEWPFPAIEDVSTSSNVSGSGTTVISGGLMPMQSPSVNGTATCSWQFSKGGTAGTSVGAGAKIAMNPALARSPAAGLAGGAAGTAAGGAAAGGAASAAGTAGAAGAAGAGAKGAAGTAAGGAAAGGAASAAGTAGAAGAAGAGAKGGAGAVSGGAAAGGAPSAASSAGAGAGTAGKAASGGAGASSGAAAGPSTGISNPQTTKQTILGSGPLGSTSNSPAQACVDAGMSLGSGSPNNPKILGNIVSGISVSDHENLLSTTDRSFYQVTLAAGVDADISLTGIQAGSDFDLYVYKADLSPIGCSTTRGTASEYVTTQFGNTQTSNVVIVEVASYGWSATAPAYTVTVKGLTAGSGGSQLVSGVQKRLPLGASSTTSQACVDAGMSQGSGSPQRPTILGTIASGLTVSNTANLLSATDRNFYQVTLAAGVDADISLTGIQPGSDFDLYLYKADLSSIGCSTTRGTASENVATQFGNTQNSNVVIVEVASYGWSATAPAYTVTIRGR